MTARIIPIHTKPRSLEATLILEPWSYTSPYGTGSDYGHNFSIYVPEQSLALYIRTRHRTTGAEPSGNWRPRDPEKYFDDTKKDIWERYTLPVHDTLEEQVNYLKTLYEPEILTHQKRLRATRFKDTKKIFQKPSVKKISLSERQAQLLFKPIWPEEDGKGLCDLLYSYVEK